MLAIRYKEFHFKSNHNKFKTNNLQKSYNSIDSFKNENINELNEYDKYYKDSFE